VDGASTPAPGWYPDPAGSSSYRWWDGGSWTAHLRAPEPVAVAPAAQVPAPALTPAPAPAPAPAPTPAVATSPVVATVATEYVGDPRFGGPGAAAAVDLNASPVAPPARRGTASTGRLPLGRSKNQLVVAGVAAVAVLVGAFFAGSALLGGSGATDDSSGGTGGLLDQGNPRVVAMHADVLSIANAEENVFAATQAYTAVTTTTGPVTIAGHAIRLSGGATAQVGVSPSGTGYCVREARTPAGGGAQQVVVYISTQGGFQPSTVTTCPAVF
jgi:hypothetical protein